VTTTTASRAGQRTIGELLRGWREQRRLSQLELALQAEVSTRHLSFVETGRASPSRELVLHLAEQLDVPLRERNYLLLAAGYAPVYQQSALDSPYMNSVREALREILVAHEPNPAVVVDRYWNIVDANTSIGIFTEDVADFLLRPPINVLRLSLHPQGVAPRIVNLGQWRGHLLARLRREVAHTADPELARLEDELREYPCEPPERVVELPGPGDVAVPLIFRYADQELRFISTVAAFGTPLDITVAELAIELFFPADSSTAGVLRAR
jgi:transcriptional regulator with XRE-family HTH domain